MWLHNIPSVTFCLIVNDSTNNFFWIVLEIPFFFFNTSHPAFVHFLLWRPPQDWRGCRLPDMWNSSSVNLSVQPYEPWPIIRCTWPLPQTLTSAKTVSSSVQICPVYRPPPRCSPIPSRLTPITLSCAPPFSTALCANLNLSHCTSVQHGGCRAHDLSTGFPYCWGHYKRRDWINK